MKVTYNSQKSETTIRLSWTETKQFLSSNHARKEVAKAVEEVVLPKRVSTAVVSGEEVSL
jgi:hypothetical protein